MGSKDRIAKYIIPIMTKNLKSDQWWVEPFVGGANIIDKINHKWRLGADINPYLIAALELIRDNPDWLPKNKHETDEIEYRNMKASNNIALKGYYGFALSYGGKWFGGWRRDKLGKRDYVGEAYRNAIKQSVVLQGVQFTCCSYDVLALPLQSVIYCDIPYNDTTKYNSGFDHKKFWDWCRKQVALGHNVFISEYTAPDDFVSVWQKEIVSSLTQNTGSKRGVERLFVHHTQL